MNVDIFLILTIERVQPPTICVLFGLEWDAVFVVNVNDELYSRIIEQEGQLLVSSIDVAEMTGKRHGNLIHMPFYPNQ